MRPAAASARPLRGSRPGRRQVARGGFLVRSNPMVQKAQKPSFADPKLDLPFKKAFGTASLRSC